MGTTLLDLLFDLVIERCVLRLGAAVLWLADAGRVPYASELERGGAAVVAGLAPIAALVVAGIAWALLSA